MVIDETGGLHGVRDAQPVLTLLDLPRQKAFGKELYRGVFTKAALHVRNIIESHPFLDGNKRTAMVAAATFLEYNRYRLVAEEGEIEKFALYVARQKHELVTIAAWLKKHARRMKK